LREMENKLERQRCRSSAVRIERRQSVDVVEKAKWQVPFQRHVIIGEIAVVWGDIRCIRDKRWREEGVQAWKQKGQVRESGERDL
jgi:hypothetical protein